MRIDDKRAAEIGGRAAKATPGTWTAARYPIEDGGIGPQTIVVEDTHCGLIADCEMGEADPEDGFRMQACNADFIAHSRTDVPDLLADRVERDAELAKVELLYPNWYGKFDSLAAAILCHTAGQDAAVTNLRREIAVHKEYSLISGPSGPILML